MLPITGLSVSTVSVGELSSSSSPTGALSEETSLPFSSVTVVTLKEVILSASPPVPSSATTVYVTVPVLIGLLSASVPVVRSPEVIVRPMAGVPHPAGLELRKISIPVPTSTTSLKTKEITVVSSVDKAPAEGSEVISVI